MAVIEVARRELKKSIALLIVFLFKKNVSHMENSIRYSFLPYIYIYMYLMLNLIYHKVTWFSGMFEFPPCKIC